MKNNMRKLFLFFILVILFNCYNSGIKLNINKKLKIEKKSAEEEKTIDHINYDVSTNELVYLFFDKSFFIIKKPVLKTPAIMKENIANVDSNDFKAVVDWQVKGGRQIRVLNIKTGKEYIIKDWEKTGEDILLERNLFYYKFKIGNSIIKVKR